jgi:ketosteroid isomerase-like protein
MAGEAAGRRMTASGPVTRTGPTGKETTMTSSPQDLVTRYYQALSDADWDAYDQLLAPDVELEAFGGVTSTGVDAVRAFDQVWKTAAPDFSITPLLQARNGEYVLCEILVWGTQTEVLSLPSGDLPPTGLEFGGKGVGIFEVRDGRISAQRIYFDRMVLVEMLGIPVAAPVG